MVPTTIPTTFNALMISSSEWGGLLGEFAFGAIVIQVDDYFADQFCDRNNGQGGHCDLEHDEFLSSEWYG